MVWNKGGNGSLPSTATQTSSLEKCERERERKKKRNGGGAWSEEGMRERGRYQVFKGEKRDTWDTIIYSILSPRWMLSVGSRSLPPSFLHFFSLSSSLRIAVFFQRSFEGGG